MKTRQTDQVGGCVLPVLGLRGLPDVHYSVQFEVVNLEDFGCIVLVKRCLLLLLASGGIDELLGILLQKHKIISHGPHPPRK